MTFDGKPLTLSASEGKAQLDVAALQKFSVMIATPTLGGNCVDSFYKSGMGLANRLTRLGISHEVYCRSGDGLMNRVRSYMAAHAIAQGHTHLFFIDADLEYEADDAIRLLAMNKGLVCAAYPFKAYNAMDIARWAFQQYENGRNFREVGEEILTATLRYPINLNLKDELECVDGAVACHEVTTGFMLIKTDVLKAIAEKRPDLKFSDDLNEAQSVRDNLYDWFGSYVDENRRMLSEDYWFCKLYRDLCGGKCWVDLNTKLNHTGPHKFKGDFGRMFVQ